MSVEQILNSFQEQLEKDALQYVREANRVAHYDAILRDSQRNCLSLTNQTSRLFAEQAEMEGIIKNIGAFQSELENNIEVLENNVDDLFQAQAHVAPRDADIERENAYSTALNLDERLSLLSQDLQSTLRLLDESQDQVLRGPVGDVVKILNNHQNGLVQLEQASRSMEQDIAQIERYLAEPR
jgi:predicted RNase H-like nuclease (RuvC/YqgF family)